MYPHVTQFQTRRRQLDEQIAVLRAPEHEGTQSRESGVARLGPEAQGSDVMDVG